MFRDARLETGDYNFYGYAPKIEGTSFDNTDKILTIPSIPALYDRDLMVINSCSVKVEKDDIEKNKTVNLLMDHLMAKITPYFYLNSEYNKLRDIQITNVEFFFDPAPKYNATITYGASSYTPKWSSITNSEAESSVTVYNTTLHEKLTTTKGAQEYGHCYIVPSQPTTNLKMKVTYDVYDKSGVKTREGVTAENVIKKLPQKLSAGTNYKLNIQVVPTYLYVLSDNDQESLVIP